jgi:hypothetical protein
VRILQDLAVIYLVTNLANLAAFVEMAASISPILVNFLRFTTGQKMAEIIGDSNDLQHKRREFREDCSKRSSDFARDITIEL